MAQSAEILKLAEDRKMEDIILAQAKEILRKRVQRNGVKIGSTEDTKDLLSLTYGASKDEKFGVILLSNSYQVLAIEELFSGSVNTVQIYTRPIVRKALEVNATYAVLFHNHPSGNPKASDGDIEQTWKISDALKSIDVRVLDHMIVAGTQVSSFVEQNLELSNTEDSA